MNHKAQGPTITLVLAVTMLGGCDEPKPKSAKIKAPAHQFVADGLDIEEQRGGHVLWSGRVAHAEGDMLAIDVRAVKLTRHPQSEGEEPVLVTAPSGHLAFDAGLATFQDVRVQHANGSVLTAGDAEYREKESRIAAKGPVRVEARGFTATGADAVVHLKSGDMEVTGPINGRWTPPPQ